MKWIIVSVFLIAIFFYGCKEKDEITNPPPVEINNLTVKVDPRMELLAVIQHYTSWAGQRHTKLHFQYIDDIDAYFKNYSSHPAILMSEQLSNNNFNYDAPPSFVLYHSDPPEFKHIIPYSSYLVNRAGGEQNLKEFADKIRDFAQTTNFKSFFDSHKSFYEQIENNIRTTIGSTNYISILEAYYGEKKHSYNIIPTPLFHSGGYGPEISTSEGQEIYNICGPQTLTPISNQPSFGTQDYMLYILLHEFSHSFVNPVAAKYSSEINASASLFNPIQNKMQQMAYGDWQTCVNEHLVRANTARFADQLRGNAIKDLYLQSEIQNGFIYITKIDSIMQIYEKNRGTYPTYGSFFPEIIKLLNSLIK
jgi:hypothetical protein